MDYSTHTLGITGEYKSYMMGLFNAFNMKVAHFFETGYEPSYQGTLFILITQHNYDDELDIISSNHLNMGDDSFTIERIPSGQDDYFYYLIDICR